MTDEKFQLPSIPQLHVPQYRLEDVTSEQTADITRTTESVANKEPVPALVQAGTFPHFCPACSLSLLQFLQPLQLYINQLVYVTSAMANKCDHLEIIDEMQKLPELLLGPVPGGKQRENTAADTGPEVQRQHTSPHTVVHHQAEQEDYPKWDTNPAHRLDRRPEKSQVTRADHQGPEESKSPPSVPKAAHTDQHRNEFVYHSHSKQEEEQQKQQPAANQVHEDRRLDYRKPGHQDPEVRHQRSGYRQSEHQQQQQQQQQQAAAGGALAMISEEESGVFSHADNSSLPEKSPSEQTVESPVSRSIAAAEQAHDVREHADEDAEEKPYAFVTIVYDNLSAVNAIILSNSLTLSCVKQTRHNGKLVRVPFVALITGRIDAVLKDFLPSVFDEVFYESRDARLSLLVDESFGVSQLKLQLWKSLAGYQKCFFIESTSLVVGNLDDVFLQFSELSACVDWLFPDSFSCTVFVFEPNVETYDQLLQYATQIVRDNDDPEVTSVDDMTILNQFFQSKWTKMSFIYNYSQNSAIYTQQPAFAKFGGSIKIVNFDFSPITGPGGFGRSTGVDRRGPSVQPWHLQFDLNQSTQSGEAATHGSINNYVRFYLNLFMKRVWPLLRESLTPLLVARNKRDWSIYELLALLKNSESSPGSDDALPYSPIILRRRSPISHYKTDEPPSPQMGPSPIPAVVEEQQEIRKDDEEDEALEEEEKEVLESVDAVEKEVKEKLRLVEDRSSDRRVWESGKADWMGAHGSDKLIDRLKEKFK